MNKKKLPIYIFAFLIGAALVYVGGFILVDENVKMVSGLCIGIGSAIASLGLGNFIGAMILSEKTYEKIKHQKNIEVKDERNQKIREKVGSKTSQIIFYLIGVLVIVLGFMKVERIIIMMVSSLLFIYLFLQIVLTDFFSKKM